MKKNDWYVLGAAALAIIVVYYAFIQPVSLSGSSGSSTS
jgi:hypothetical protein